MASSNRHWPSLFKSKPCNTPHQWQHDINPSSLISGGYQKTPYTSGCEERSPEPKPRWNPKPEQIRILEAIFNSGMVNPPRDEIRRIRAQLQEYGQVGDANVFYWFQNRKSRSKHKQRHLQSSRPHLRSATTATTTPSLHTTTALATTATSSSSLSSDLSSGPEKAVPSVASTGGVLAVTDMPASTPVAMNQLHFHVPMEFGGEPFFLQGPQTYCLPPQDLRGIVGAPEQGAGVCSALWSELLGQEGCKGDENEAKTKMQLHHSLSVGAACGAAVTSVGAAVDVSGGATTVGAANSASVACPSSVIQGMGGAGGGGATRATVFINEVAFQVGAGPFNVREAFGEEAVLLHSSGLPVLTDELGVTLQPLQHGASYYVV